MKNPMLAAKVEDLSKLNLTYPVIVQPKYDGIRCLLDTDGVAYSRTLKLIPNKCIRRMLYNFHEQFTPTFVLDGELWAKHMDYNHIQSIVMSESHPDEHLISYVIYDAQIENMNYQDRWSWLVRNTFPSSRIFRTHYLWGADYTDLITTEHIIVNDENYRR